MKALTKIALVFVAGYCDTATFVHMDEVFSAHVTGNFVIFAVAVAQGVEMQDYLKILTFPVFLLAVIIGTVLYRLGQGQKEKDHSPRLLRAMTALLVACSIITITFSVARGTINLGWLDIMVTVLLVLALGIQNTIHHFLPGPLTTVMTGTVMNTTASITERYLFRHVSSSPDSPAKSLVSPLRKIVFFALGCLLSAFLTIQFGLAAILVPTLIMLGVITIERDTDAADDR